MNTRSGLAQSGLLQHRPYSPQTALYFEWSTETVNTGGGKNGCQALALSESLHRCTLYTRIAFASDSSICQAVGKPVTLTR